MIFWIVNESKNISGENCPNVMAVSYMMTNVIDLPNLLTPDKWSFFPMFAIMWFKQETYIAKNTQNEWMIFFITEAVGKSISLIIVW